MTLAMFAGALVGLGVFGLYRSMFPARPGMVTRLSAYDEMVRRSPRAKPAAVPEGWGERLQARIGKELARICEARGWQLRSYRADLALVGKDFETFLAVKVLLPVIALIFTPLLMAAASIVGGMPMKVPMWAGLIMAGLFFLFPDLQLRQDAARARDDFRHVVGAFLDLVAMNLAGGRGVPEALMTASNVGDGWAMLRIREALANARISGHTPWQALGLLGEQIDVTELCDLSSALALVADDGAKVRQSLAARAASMRSREISTIEGKAGQNSQTMLVAQLLFCLGFLIFLIYPSLVQIMDNT